MSNSIPLVESSSELNLTTSSFTFVVVEFVKPLQSRVKITLAAHLFTLNACIKA